MSKILKNVNSVQKISTMILVLGVMTGCMQPTSGHVGESAGQDLATAWSEDPDSPTYTPAKTRAQKARLSVARTAFEKQQDEEDIRSERERQVEPETQKDQTKSPVRIQRLKEFTPAEDVTVKGGRVAPSEFNVGSAPGLGLQVEPDYEQEKLLKERESQAAAARVEADRVLREQQALKAKEAQLVAEQEKIRKQQEQNKTEEDRKAKAGQESALRIESEKVRKQQEALRVEQENKKREAQVALQKQQEEARKLEQLKAEQAEARRKAELQAQQAEIERNRQDQARRAEQARQEQLKQQHQAASKAEAEKQAAAAAAAKPKYQMKLRDGKMPHVPQGEIPVPEAKPAQQTAALPKTEEKPRRTQIAGVREPDGREIAERGVVTPTVYFISIHNEDQPSCDKEDLRSFNHINGKKIMNVCERTLSFCSVQGSCVIRKDGKWVTYNIIKKVGGVARFSEITDGCKYGWGVRQICLDPFYSVAADLSIYDPGDVIFIPKLRGQLLPNGQRHDGYLIVRDKGKDIKGKGRFDFYSGSMNWKDTINPFTRLRLNDKSTDHDYQKVSGDVAARVRAKRGYPKLPSQGVIEMAMATVNTHGVPTL